MNGPERKSAPVRGRSDQLGGDQVPSNRNSSETVTPIKRGPYREVPADFREQFLALGWDEALRERYRAGWATITAWVRAAGGEELKAERRRRTGAPARPWLRSENRKRRYVLGQTLSRGARS